MFCSVIIKPRMRAPHGAGWPLPPFCGGRGLQWQFMGQKGGLEAEGEKRNGSSGNEVNREERFGTVDHAVGRMLWTFKR